MPVFKVVLQQTIRKWSVIKADNEQEAADLALDITIDDWSQLDSDATTIEVASVELTDLTFPD
jgi:hypothetical protein